MKSLKSRMCLVCLVGSLLWAGSAFAIRPGDTTPQPPQSPQGLQEPVPNVPQSDAQPSAAPNDSRKIIEQPRPIGQIQKHFVDAFLAKSVWHVTDPQDGMSQDGRVAVLEGMNAQVVYQFYKEHKVVNVPNQADLTIYTLDKGGFSGPYNVFAANFGDTTWTQLGANVMGTASFDLPPTLPAVELVLLVNQSSGATYIEAIEGLMQSGGIDQGTFSYFPEEVIGLRAERLDCAELERARALLTNSGQGYQLMPFGEIEIRWNTPIKNLWKTPEFFIQAEGEYEIYAGDSRGMESLIGRKAGNQGVDLPQDMLDVAKVRIRNHNSNRPVILFAIAGRR